MGFKVEIGYLDGGRSNILIPWERFVDGRWEFDLRLEEEVVREFRQRFKPLIEALKQ